MNKPVVIAMKVSAECMSTGFRLSTPKAVAHYDFGLSAIALAQPPNKSMFSLFGLLDNGQLAKPVASHINHFGHRSLLFGGCECSTLMVLFNAEFA
jgi:hypothetical protein